MGFLELTTAETDAKSPIDDALWLKVKDNFTDLNSRLIAAKTFPYDYRINGPLSFINPHYGKRKRLDGALISNIQTLTFAKLYCEVPGTYGTLSIDLRKYKKTNTLISAITRQYSGAISSITQVAPSLATQSITRATAQVSTQSIARWKASVNVASIVPLPDNYVRYNLTGPIDSDWSATFLAASCTNAANNGTFTIVRINEDGGNNIIVLNASGVAQTGAVGNVSLNSWAFNFTNPVDSQFAANEGVTLAGHTSGATNGSWTLYAVNQGGNNVIIQGSTIVAQASPAGTMDVRRFTYTFTAPVSSDFVVGEYAAMNAHTSGVNDGYLLIKGVNVGGNNVIVYNVSGTPQGGAAGTTDTSRWIYALTSDPSSQIQVGDAIVGRGTTNAGNAGTHAVKEVNRSATNNIVISNLAGVAQGGAVGTLVSALMLVSFLSDQSAVYSTASNIELSDTTPNSANIGYFDVVQVNRGGGSNYNVTISIPGGIEQPNPAGRILSESKSVLSAPLTLTFGISDINTNNNSYLQIASTTSMSSEAVFSTADIAAGAVLAVDINSIPSGNISDIVIQTA